MEFPQYKCSRWVPDEEKTVNILNKQLHTSNKRWFFSLGVWQGANKESETPLGLLDPEYEGSLILLNIRKYTPNNILSNSRRPESSDHCCENLKTLQTTPHLKNNML
jgi:hypothetical protein